MESFAEIADHCPDSDLPLISELLADDVQCPVSCTFVRDGLGQLFFTVPPSPLHWSRQMEWPWVLRNGDFQQGQRVLDAGSGWSILKFALARRTGNVTCLESDPEFVNRAQIAIDLRNENHRIRQVVGDVRKVPYPDGWFDKVVCVSVIEHMTEGHLDAVKELVRVLKIGGTLLMTMDVRLNEGGDHGDFHLSIDEARKMLNSLGIYVKPHGPRIIGSHQMGDKVEILVLMVKYFKIGG